MKTFRWGIAFVAIGVVALVILAANADDGGSAAHRRIATEGASSQGLLLMVLAGMAAMVWAAGWAFRELKTIEVLACRVLGLSGVATSVGPIGFAEMPLDRIAASGGEAARPRRSEHGANAMADDVRIPVGTVLGRVELLLAEDLSPRQQEYVQDIQAAAASLMAVFGGDGPVAEASVSTPGEHPTEVRVLVVDDNAVNLEVARGLIGIEGLGCDTASSGAEALAKIAANEYSLVLMDYMMPEMDGMEATRRIRMMPGAKGGVPVVAFTANDEILGRYREAGMDDFLLKPISRDALRRVLLQWLPEGRALPVRYVRERSCSFGNSEAGSV